MKDRKTAPRTARAKSKKASSRVTAAEWNAAVAAGASVRSARKAIGKASVEKLAGRQFQKTRGQAIQGHITARGRRQQARRDSR